MFIWIHHTQTGPARRAEKNKLKQDISTSISLSSISKITRKTFSVKKRPTRSIDRYRVPGAANCTQQPFHPRAEQGPANGQKTNHPRHLPCPQASEALLGDEVSDGDARRNFLRPGSSQEQNVHFPLEGKAGWGEPPNFPPALVSQARARGLNLFCRRVLAACCEKALTAAPNRA